MKNSENLTWQSVHVLLSVNVCSNVPEYQEQKCFISKEFITEFIEYLVSIRTKSSSLLQEQYAPVFEALNHAAVSSRGETHEDQLAEMLVDMQEGNKESGSGENESKQETGEDSEDESRGIDLMSTDDEDNKEEIESENDEDRAFLDDEVSGKGPSFYRRLNVQLDTEWRQEQRQRRKEIADCEDMLFGEVRTSDNIVLNELAQKVNAYLSELPVLGFNSGK